MRRFQCPKCTKEYEADAGAKYCCSCLCWMSVVQQDRQAYNRMVAPDFDTRQVAVWISGGNQLVI